MIQGYFGSKGEMFFEIELIAADGSVIAVDALLDTGFTDWLAMDTQDVESLGWLFVEREERLTAQGVASFNLYEGSVLFDSQELTFPVVVGDGVPEVLIGLPWLETRRLMVDRKIGLLTLGED